MIKTYNRAKYREKFRRYRVAFLIFAVAFFAALMTELFLLGDLGYELHREGCTFSSFFSDLFAGELLTFITAFLFGVTLYAPVIGFLSSLARGAFSGFCIALLISGTEDKNGVWLLLLTILYLLLSAWIFLGYATFCTTTALQIYSDPTRSAQGGEKQMYGGTLFYSSFSKGAVNWRFLFSYVLFFLAAVFFVFLFALGFSAIRCKI